MAGQQRLAVTIIYIGVDMQDNYDERNEEYAVFKAVKGNIFYDVSEQIQREYDAETSVAETIDDLITMASDHEGEFQIYQWWTVSDEFARAASRTGEFILSGLPFGTIWGRQTCGQKIEQDENVQDIFRSMRLI